MNFFSPKVLLRLEGLVVVVTACTIYAYLSFSWIAFALFILAPDLSMLGFLVSKKVGTITYNVFHTYSIPLLIFLMLFCLGQSNDESDASPGWSPFLVELAIIWLAHIGFDRMLGYGIKYGTAFKDTHLQQV